MIRTRMSRILFLLLAVTFFFTTSCKKDVVTSPNGKITIEQKDNQLQVKYCDKAALTIEKIGFKEFNKLSDLKFSQPVSDDYVMPFGKKSHYTNQANEYFASLDENVKLILLVYDNGVAFRYLIRPQSQDFQIPEETTAFRIAEGTKRWMQQWCDSYEGFFPESTTAKVQPVPSFSGINKSAEGYNCRWGYPALLEPVDDVFVLLTESDIKAFNSASSLWNDENAELYTVRPDQNDAAIEGDFYTPWRVAVIGQLADIVESTLVTDLAEPSKIEDTQWVEPGVVSWIYWAYNHGSNDYNIIKKYVDLAVSLKLTYMLIDAEWDEMKDGKTIEDAVKYAVDNGVKPLIWYSSSIGWVDGAPGPKFRLNKPEDREKEFTWLEKIGVAGVKIDFFSGDNQKNMSYCIDLLQSAANHHLTVNFHGATLPRGWQRTFPNLLSTEAVYGAEWYNNVPTFTNKAAAHNATLPFTRNVVGSMDYTPCAFSDSQNPHITTNAHELALTVLFESGLQHLADRPESLLAQPQEVQDFFGKLPAAWDEIKFVGGYPADYVVIARKRNNKWYVAGINGTDADKTISLDLSFVGNGNFRLFEDGENAEQPWKISDANGADLPKELTLKPRGGFVMAEL